MRTKILSIALLISIGFIACKKTSTTENPNLPIITGKWKYIKTVLNDFYLDSSHVYTYPGDALDYVDFRTDGIAYSLTRGSYDTTVYGIIGNTKIWTGTPPDTFDIKLLTNSDLQLYKKTVSSASEYYEVITYLTK